MTVLQYSGYLPDPFVKRPEGLMWVNIILILVLINGLLGTIAATSAYAASLLWKNMEPKEIAYRARQAELAKSEFFANMSHELRTPLNHIIGFTELVVEKYFGNLNKAREEYLIDVLNNSKHLLSLINDILDLSKVESGKLELQPAAVNIRAILSDSPSMTRERSIKHGIRVSPEIGEDVSETARAGERKLKQVLYNFISNSTKFAPDGGTGGGSVCPCTEQQNGGSETYLRFSVTDSGIGVDPENPERIFKPFEQIESSLSRKYEGTGLGLSLSKRLVELHGGRIWAESEGKGSTFAFIILIEGMTSGKNRRKSIRRSSMR